MYGEPWNGMNDLQGWSDAFIVALIVNRWMSEKMDGVRAFWNGETLKSKQSKEILCPKWFIEGLPKRVKIDGELWMGRRQFETTVARLNSLDETSWLDMKFVAFDIIVPDIPYEARIEQLKRLQLPSHASVVNIEVCLGNDHLIQCLRSIISSGGEGIIATKPQSFYIPERTSTRLKVKVTNLTH